jgi:hypothetical protein
MVPSSDAEQDPKDLQRAELYAYEEFTGHL